VTNFLGVEAAAGDLQTARYVVLPVPYEGTVTYERGMAEGPAAILRASEQIELYDEELGAEFHDAGIATLPEVEPAPDPAEMMRRVRETAAGPMWAGKFVLALGGEHSITVPLVEAAIDAFGPLSVLQIDAHADLRDTYDGTPHSHACVMRRVLERTDRVCQVGVRSYSREEAEGCPEEIGRLITPALIRSDPEWIDRALDLLGERVYVTVDMDGLDPSLAPGVGTPEPGGLSWEEVTGLLRRVCAEREIVAADVVEVRPIPPHHVTEFVAARLATKIILYAEAKR
jgi:agmatinase